jgi:dsRNA-specific ribonuclease
VIDQRHFPSAWGANKKEAEQKAAYNALVELGVVPKSAVHDLI